MRRPTPSETCSRTSLPVWSVSSPRRLPWVVIFLLQEFFFSSSSRAFVVSPRRECFGCCFFCVRQGTGAVSVSWFLRSWQAAGLGVACWRISVSGARFLEIIVRRDLGHGVLPSVCRLVAVFGLHVWGEEAVAAPLGSSLLQSSFWSGLPRAFVQFCVSIR